ncbi:MAG TPA: hypothetical protein VGN01_16740 [Acidobacteriaceae bacterium]
MPTNQLHSDVELQEPVPHDAAGLKLAAYLLFAIALAITIKMGVEHAPRAFEYPHDSVSADVVTTARTFATQGVISLHGSPVNNNPPVGQGDVYAHWPPLLPVLLSVCIHLFGASERVAHLFMLGVVIATALLVCQVGRLWLGNVGGALAGYFWLTLPVVVQFGHLVAQQSLAMLFVVAAALALHSRRFALASILLFFGVFSSWEAALVLIGVYAAAWGRPEMRRPVWIASGAVAAGILCVLLLLSPGGLSDTWQTVRFYMGLSSTYSNVLPHDHVALSFSQQIEGIVWNHIWMLGVFGSAAAVQLVLSQRRVLVVSVLAAPWCVWAIAMRTHMAIHDFELLIAAPIAALGLAWMATTIPRVMVLVGLSVLQLFFLHHPPTEDYPASRLVEFGREIKAGTNPGSIVVSPLLSEIPLYYSERHIIRGISDENAVEKQVDLAHRRFPGAPVYLALPPQLVGDFPKSNVVFSGHDAVILKR